MIHPGLTYAEYSALPGWNWSLIKLLEEQSPRHVLHACRNRDPGDSAARNLLRAIHTLTLEADRFAAEYAVFDGIRRGAVFEEFRRANLGKTILNPTEHETAIETAASILTFRPAGDLLTHGSAEVSITWTDAATGLPCKGRIDWLGPMGLVDVKTLGTTNERDVARMAAKNLYHGQLAHYTDGLRAHGIDVPAFLVVAEGKGAMDVAVFEVDSGIPDGALTVGTKLRARLMRRLAECVATDVWPGRIPEVTPMCLPMWALDDAMDAITVGGEAV